jgi:hypothetical protein
LGVITQADGKTTRTILVLVKKLNCEDRKYHLIG